MNNYFKLLGLFLITSQSYSLHAGLSYHVNKALARFNFFVHKNDATKEKQEYGELQVECFIKEVEKYLKDNHLALCTKITIHEEIGRVIKNSQAELVVMPENGTMQDGVQVYTFGYSSEVNMNCHDNLHITKDRYDVFQAYSCTSQLIAKRAEIKQAIDTFQNNGNILTSDEIDYFSWLCASSKNEEGSYRMELLQTNRRNIYYAALPVKVYLIAAALVTAGASLYKKSAKDNAKKPVTDN